MATFHHANPTKNPDLAMISLKTLLRFNQPIRQAQELYTVDPSARSGHSMQADTGVLLHVNTF